jgi:hypothetical protein
MTTFKNNVSLQEMNARIIGAFLVYFFKRYYYSTKSGTMH